MSTNFLSQNHVVARQLHPFQQGSYDLNLESVLKACGRMLELGQTMAEDAFRLRFEACRQAESFERTPIVGICGTVNSGKSSIVAGFLSEAGCRRVLVGEKDSEGTHRFVFWLPLAWKENGLGDVVSALIQTATHTAPEMLSEDPAAAALQYNATKDRALEFNIPLLAFDPQLDGSGIAYLDCPDTQRSLDEHDDEFTANLRMERLKTIAPMCSAFVVVASMQQKGAEVIGKVFKAIGESASEALLYFVLNMTRTNDVDTYRRQAINTLDRWRVTSKVRRLYISPYIHTSEPSEIITPVVTSMDEDRVHLKHLGEELNPAELQRRHRESCFRHLKDLLDQVAKQMRERYKTDCNLVSQARSRVCMFLEKKFIDDNGKPRALEFNEVARQMAVSIQRTAPLPIRIAQAPGNWLRDLKTKWIKRRATDSELDQYAQIDATDFSSFLIGSRFLRPDVEPSQLDAVWKQAFDAVIRKGKETSLNSSELDAMTKRMWDGIPFGKKIALLKNVMIAAGVIAVAGALLPFDGGATVILVAKAHMVLGGPEILGILVGGPLLGTLMTGKDAQQLITKFEQECARPQLDAIYAALADGLGIPREFEGFPQLTCQGKVCHEFKESALERLPDQINVLGHPLIRLDETLWNEMMQPLTQSKP